MEGEAVTLHIVIHSLYGSFEGTDYALFQFQHLIFVIDNIHPLTLIIFILHLLSHKPILLHHLLLLLLSLIGLSSLPSSPAPPPWTIVATGGGASCPCSYSHGWRGIVLYIR